MSVRGLAQGALGRSADASREAQAAAARSLAERLREMAPTLAILLIVLLAVSDSVDRADWVAEMPDLRLLAVLALAVAAFLAPARVHWAPVIAGGMLIGAIIVLWQVLTVESIGGQPLFFDRFEDLWFRLEDWFRQAFSAGIATDNLPFVLFVVAAVWAAAFWGSFAMLRWRHPWLLLLLLGAILAVNVSFQRRDQWDANLAVFVGGAALLVAQAHLLRRRKRWQANGSAIPRSLTRNALLVTALLVAVLLGASRAVPHPNEVALSSLWDDVTEPFRGLNDDFARLFGGIDSKSGGGIHSFGDGFALLGDISPGDSIVARVESREPGLLRGAAYDVYTTRGWLQRGIGESRVPADGESLGAGDGEAPAEAPAYQERREVTVGVSAARSPRAYFTLGQPLDVDREASVAQTSEVQVRVGVSDPTGEGVPAVLSAAVGAIQEAQRAGPLSDEEAIALLPEQYAVERVQRGLHGITAITVTSGPPEPDILAFRAEEAVRAGTRYETRGSVSEASEEQLQAAGSDYPFWVLDRNLQLPSDLSDEDLARIRALARAVSAAAETPYEVAEVLERYLCCTVRLDADGVPALDSSGEPQVLYRFNPDIPLPPALTDAVSWFLFDAQERASNPQGGYYDYHYPLGGYYDYHASALAVMLRSLEIPARISTGYVLNDEDYDIRTGAYIVRGRHAYTWVEVFFPEYGWVDFDPTPTATGQAFADIRGERIAEQRRVALESDIFEPEGEPRFGAFASLIDDPDLLDALLAEQIAERSGGGGGMPLAVWIGLLAGLGGVVVAGVSGRLAWEWSLRGLSPAERAWASLQLFSRWAGFGSDPSRTPGEYAATVGKALGRPVEARLLADSYVGVRYGRRSLNRVDVARLRLAWRTLRQLLLRRIVRSLVRLRFIRARR